MVRMGVHHAVGGLWHEGARYDVWADDDPASLRRNHDDALTPLWG